MTTAHRATRKLAGLTGSAALVPAGTAPAAQATPHPEPPG